MTGRDDPTSVRLDKWLWAARFYKTRTAATEAVHGGKVEVNGESAKPARAVVPGDTITVRIPPFTTTLVVTGLAERRGSAAVAAGLYEETAESREARTRHAQLLRDAPLLRFDEGKPSKRDRRRLDRLRGRE
ncbi:MAG: RNA-binding S4 domain-containing protein [Gemmatimonadales bacterium]